MSWRRSPGQWPRRSRAPQIARTWSAGSRWRLGDAGDTKPLYGHGHATVTCRELNESARSALWVCGCGSAGQPLWSRCIPRAICAMPCSLWTVCAHCPPTAPPLRTPNTVTSVLLYCLLTSGQVCAPVLSVLAGGGVVGSGRTQCIGHGATIQGIPYTGVPTTAAAACSTHLAMTLSMSSIGTNTSRSWSCGMKSPAVWVRAGSKIQVVACSER